MLMFSFCIDTHSYSSVKRMQALLEQARPLDQQQKDAIYHACSPILASMTSLLVCAIEEAHKSEQLDPIQFWKDLFLGGLCSGTIHGTSCTYQNRPIMTWDKKNGLHPDVLPSPDPYCKLDFQAALKYLYFNIGRRRNVNGELKPLRDHESFYRFFGLMSNLKEVDLGSNRLGIECGEFTRALSKLVDHRNVLMHNSEANRNAVTLPDYADSMSALYIILAPLCNTKWCGQQDAIHLWNTLDMKFYAAAGAVHYPLSALMQHGGIADHQLPLLEQLLSEAGIPVTSGTVALQTNPERFALAMAYALMDTDRNWDRSVAILRENAAASADDKPANTYDDTCARPSHLRNLSLQALHNMVDKGLVKAQVELGCRYWLGTGGVPQDRMEAFRCFDSAVRQDPANRDAQFYLGRCWDTGHCPGGVAVSSKALSHFRKAARAGHAQAMVIMGRSYAQQGHLDQAFEMYTQAAQSGDPDGLFHLGQFYEKGIQCTQNWDEATLLYREAAESGHRDARFALAMILPLYEDGTPTEEALLLLQELSQTGDARAKYQLARYGDPQAETLLLQAAESGYTAAWILLGDLQAPAGNEDHTRYWGRAEDWDKSMSYYRKAAEAGDPEGFYQMGWVLWYLHGLDRLPPPDAMEHFQAAANRRYAPALRDLGIWQLEHGVAYHGDEPFYYPLADAAALGDQRAQLLADVFTPCYPGPEFQNWDSLIQRLLEPAAHYAIEKYALAYCYRSRAEIGLGDPERDLQAARKWLKMAAGEGCIAAMRELYELTCQENPDGAIAWLRKAAQAGSYGAFHLLYTTTCGTDPDGAAAWLRQGAQAGDDGCKHALDCLFAGDPVCFDPNSPQ